MMSNREFLDKKGLTFDYYVYVSTNEIIVQSRFSDGFLNCPVLGGGWQTQWLTFSTPASLIKYMATLRNGA